jgi:hypothetical protein
MQAMALKASSPTRAVIKFAGGLVVFYVLVYLLLSLRGGYQPVVWTSAAVHEDLIWAPLGFDYTTPAPSGATATERNHTRTLIIAFYPLWVADISLIHKTKYDVHRPNT